MIPAGFDFTDPDLYASRLPFQEWAELRRTAPVWWNAQPYNTAGGGRANGAGGKGEGPGRLRRGRGRRVAPAGDRGTDRDPAGGPPQDLRVVHPDDRLRRPRIRRRADGRLRRAGRLCLEHGRG